MVEKRNRTKGISFGTLIIISLVVIVVVVLGLKIKEKFIGTEIVSKSSYAENGSNGLSENLSLLNSGGYEYYSRLSDASWSGIYKQNNYNAEVYSLVPNETSNYTGIYTYEEYLEIIDTINSMTEDKITDVYPYDEGTSYAILKGFNEQGISFELLGFDNYSLKVVGEEEIGNSEYNSFIVVIPFATPSKKGKNEIESSLIYHECYTDKEIMELIKNRKEEQYFNDPRQAYVDKPVIYLYPEEDTNLSVKLVNEDLITCSYPKYKDLWNVLAKTDGTIIDLDTNKELYSLYYESKAIVKPEVKEDGFVVKGEDSAKFLEEKLEILGLNSKEAEEFIIYWLPKLEANKYNYIRFLTMEEIEENMPIEFSVKPDSLIRIMMSFKGLDESINVKEQKLKTPQRTGFVAVEWGGTEIK